MSYTPTHIQSRGSSSHVRAFVRARRLNTQRMKHRNGLMVLTLKSNIGKTAGKFFSRPKVGGALTADVVGTTGFSAQSASVRMGLHSYKCRDPATRWNGSECVDCPRKAGHEVSPNCGYSDDGGRHEPPLKPCPGNTFNDGSTAMCRTCSSCQTGFEIVSPCNPTTDTKCEQRHPTSTVHPTEPQTTRDVSVFSDNTTSVNGRIEVHKESEHNTLLWAVPLILFISFMLVLSACIIYKKWKKGKHTVLSFSRSSLIERQFPPFCAPAGDVDLENILSPNILSAPLQTVLDNLDVLEELVILLDPESPTVKNTKHLASLCHFPSTWITYTYSMKESKSPLKAVIEGVSSRNPDWTIEHLAKRLRLIERNDAIAVLAKLQLNSIVQ